MKITTHFGKIIKGSIKVTNENRIYLKLIM